MHVDAVLITNLQTHQRCHEFMGDCHHYVYSLSMDIGKQLMLWEEKHV